ncbi:MAG: hypothetical protein JNK31_00665 [Candidatus Competibacter sp.]|nr:hypothetical protein [Candidatus Competibacter sp.]
MHQNQVPLKTIKGLQEIETRSHHLPAELRRILIMVDGHSTVTEMTKKLVSFGNIQQLLTQLEHGDFIISRPDPDPPSQKSQRPFSSDPLSKKSQRPPESSAASSSRSDLADATHAEFNLDKAKGFIRYILFGAMGPTAERRINRVEATGTPEELRLELDAIRDMLPKVLSKQEAHQAWRQLEPIMLSITAPPAR